MKYHRFLKIEQARANSFNLFSALFCQPEDEILRNPELFASLRKIVQDLNMSSLKEIDVFENALKKYTETELLIEYSKLFVGPFKTLAPPYSSVYLGEPTVMSDETIWVLNQYRNMGLDFNSEIRDLPDHIAIETEYLYYLIFNEIQNITEGKIEKAKEFHSAQDVFLNQHFNKWVPRFCDIGKKATQNDFYNSLFIILDRFVRTQTLLSLPDQ